ncbi:MAG TPA: 30S ribosomal protein S3 [Candidatus Paceibacterota bacterium]|jgi:small subunit ribosomal protein S3|nr:30S ribosomal protein S3 [Candidatus Paceibacterota bacterium]
MSKIVHPYAHRLPLIRGWKSRWFRSGSEYRDTLRADILIREYLEKKLRTSYLSGVEFERNSKNIKIIIATARPGMVIGRSGEGVEVLKKDIIKFLKRHKIVITEALHIDIVEVRNPDADAAIIAYSIAEQLEKRLPFRRVLKQTIEKIMAARGVKGGKIVLSGRLGGADMARREEIKLGGIPLQFMRGDIDYATDTARMTYGGVGIKVWIYKGDTLENIAPSKN